MNTGQIQCSWFYSMWNSLVLQSLLVSLGHEYHPKIYMICCQSTLIFDSKTSPTANQQLQVPQQSQYNVDSVIQCGILLSSHLRDTLSKNIICFLICLCCTCISFAKGNNYDLVLNKLSKSFIIICFFFFFFYFRHCWLFHCIATLNLSQSNLSASTYPFVVSPKST